VTIPTATRRTQSCVVRALAAGLALASVATACTGGKAKGPGSSTTGSSTGSTSTTTGKGPGVPATSAEPGKQLGFRLSKGAAVAGAATATPVVGGTPLDDAAVNAIIARLSPWDDKAAVRAAFKWPTVSLPAPRPGRTIDQSFPAAAAPAPVESTEGPLQVERFQPEGDIAIAPFISITFNHAMVPITTLGQLAASDVPVRITPVVEGKWQWIGTKTLRFDAAVNGIDRLPMSTEYKVVVPAGTKAAVGAPLAKEVAFAFRTPPVTVQSVQPSDGSESLSRTPIFVLAFDQRVDPARVLETIKLASDDKSFPVRLATADEIKADKTVDVSSFPDARWVAFRAVDQLPTDTAFHVEVDKGTKSAEGPRTTTETQRYSFRTYRPLRLKSTSCGDCNPGSNIIMEFSNELDVAKIDSSKIKVDPEVPGQVVNVFGNVVAIGGATKAKTSYQVSVPAGVPDVFGQTLDKAAVGKVQFGSAEPRLQPFGSPLVTLDPLAGTSGVSVNTVNHAEVRARVLQVSPNDWPAFMRYVVEASSDREPTLPNWKVLFDKRIATGGKADEAAETQLDLAPYLGADGVGHVVVLIDPTEKYDRNDQLFWQNRPTFAWVQATNLGIDGIRDLKGVKIWATELTTGKPIANVAISTIGGTESATTDANGLASFAAGAGTGISAVLATKGNDTAFLAAGEYGPWTMGQPLDEGRWYIVDDRHVYRPGETVSIKGWLRRFETTGDAQLHMPDSGASINYIVNDAYGIKLAEGTSAVTPAGGFDLAFDLPAGANLGQAYVQFTSAGVPALLGGGMGHQFQIEQFRRPEFEVVTHPEGSATVVSTKPATVAADASYFAGGPLGAAPVSWQVTTSTASFAPVGWNEYTFGEWTPWWLAGSGRSGGFRAGFGGRYGGDFEGGCCGPFGSSSVKTFSGETDTAGSHYLKLDFEGVDGGLPDLPVTVRAQASVTDVNRQQFSSTTDLLVHPADFYVGLQGTTTFVKKGDPLDIKAIVTDIDGKVAAGRAVRIVANRIEWKVTNGEWKEVAVDPQTCEKTSAAEPVTCSFTTPVGGTYRVTATIADDNGGRNRSQLTRWVTGAQSRPARNVAQEELTIVPDRKEYAPGDTAKLLVQAPFATGHGIVTLGRVGIDATQTFELQNGSAVVDIPVADRDVPTINVAIEVVGTAVRNGDDGRPLAGAPARPAFAVGALSLGVSTASRTLTVAAVPRNKALKPDESTKVDVNVAGPNGAPVAGAEFAVVVVDEAVLALSKYSWTDPRELFYSPVNTYIDARLGRSTVILANPEVIGATDLSSGGEAKAAAATTTAAASSAPPRPGVAVAEAAPAALAPGDKTAAYDQRADVGRAYGGGAVTTGIDTRTNFDSLVVFKPTVTTDSAGKAVIDVKLPDNLTRYRVMVVAVSGVDKFGSADATITARLPLMVRPSAPRFLNFGDSFELPVVLQNQTETAMTVDVALQTSNLKATGPAGKQVSVPANDRVEVRFPVATIDAGTARFRVAASSGTSADAATVEVPVNTPATTEAFATYGVLDQGVEAQPLVPPTDVIPQFGGLDITTSSTVLQGLTDAVLKVVRDPYLSADGYASRILTITSLRPVLSAFDAPGLPSASDLDAVLSADIQALASLQNNDGGFGFWERGRPSDPYISIGAAHALVVARSAGFSVPANAWENAQGYLMSIEDHFPSEYGEDLRDALSAYALNVRGVAGLRDASKAQGLWDRRGAKMQIEAVAWLWPVIDDKATDQVIERRIQNAAVETAGAANFTASYGDRAYLILSSDRRTDAVVLDALIAKRPTSTLIPKVVTGLLGHRRAGAWNGGQENTFILLALKKYFETYETATPAFVAKVWLGDRFAGDQAFSGRSTDRLNVNVPTADLASVGKTNVVIANEGVGRLYYRIGLRYAPAALKSDPLDRGFVVARTYEAIDKPTDVRLDSDGVWHIKAGAKVRVKLTMVARSQRTQVALIDPLPAGLEIVNPALATSPPTTGDTNGEGGPDGPNTTVAVGGPLGIPIDFGWRYGTWFEHQNLRDEQAEAFTSLLPAGTYDYSYVARATTPGSFVTPPARAEQIYEPETFGRSGSTTVVIEG
jgi:alpha-2-macroglobulin